MKINANVEICLGNNLDNFQLHRFTVRENIAKSFRGWFFDSHCTVCDIVQAANADHVDCRFYGCYLFWLHPL